MSEPNCLKCKTVLTEENRYKTKTKRFNQCIECRRAYAREYAKKNRKDEGTSDTCFKCNKQFDEVDRWKNNQCIECYREYQRSYQAKRRLNPKEIAVTKERDRNCFKCKIEFTSENRYRTTNQCIECYRELNRDWYEKNKTSIRTKYNERYHSDDKFKEYCNYKKALYRIVNGTQKSSKYINFEPKEMFGWFKFLAKEYSFEYEAIKSCKLVIDHVIPLDKGLKDEIDWKYVIGWWNMSPLEPEENLTKNKRLDESQLLKHRDTLIKYTQMNDIRNQDIEVYLKHLQDTS